MCHVSCVRCHMSHVMCHMSCVIFLFCFSVQVVKLVRGGSDINGATPSSFGGTMSTRASTFLRRISRLNYFPLPCPNHFSLFPIPVQILAPVFLLILIPLPTARGPKYNTSNWSTFFAGDQSLSLCRHGHFVALELLKSMPHPTAYIWRKNMHNAA